MTNKYIITFLAMACGLTQNLHAFGFGDIADSVSSATSAITDSSNDDSDALVAKQKQVLANYKASKINLLEGYSYVLSSLGATQIEAEVNTTVDKLEDKSTDVSTIISATTDIIANKSYESLLSAGTSVLDDQSKSMYSNGIGKIQESVTAQIQVAKDLANITKDSKTLMQNSTTAEKIKLVSAIEPSVELGKEIANDIAQTKEILTKVVEIAKANNISISDTVSNLIK